MKRKIEYIAEDGTVFGTRAEAATYEVNSARKKRVIDFLKKHLNMTEVESASVTVPNLVEIVIAHASEFADVLSARATKRQLRQTQVPLRRTRYRGKLVSNVKSANG